MTTALISPLVLRWARERANFDIQQLAGKAHVSLENVLLWEKGETKPSFKQAQDIACALHIPFGFLFLSQPPEEKLPIPDLRTLGDHPSVSLSMDVRDLVADVLRKQAWFIDYLLEQGEEPLPFIGRFNLDARVEDIAADLNEVLCLNIFDRSNVRSWEDFLNYLIEKAEDAGIWVMQSGIVGNNTHRPLSVQEFRGFAISDAIAPLVFLNGKDSKAAQIFTLIHELAHLWLGQSGISNMSLAQPGAAAHKRIEKLCNAVAAEVLTPQSSFKECWSEQ